MRTRTIITVLIAVSWLAGCQQKNAALDVTVPPPPQKADLESLQISGEVPIKPNK